MAVLRRLTSEYVEGEDRIRLSGELDSGEVVVMWLTRRLLERLIRVLVRWCETAWHDQPNRELLQGFAQQSAQTAHEPQPPVAGCEVSRQWLVECIDMQFGAEDVGLVFRGGTVEACIDFAPTALRQWLGILRQAYRIAEWPLDVWPAWMAFDADTAASKAVLLH